MTERAKLYLKLSIILRTTGLILVSISFIGLILSSILTLQHTLKVELSGYVLQLSPFVIFGMKLLPFIIASIVVLCIGQIFEYRYKQTKKNHQLTILEKKMKKNALRFAGWFAYTAAVTAFILIIEIADKTCEKSIYGSCSIESGLSSYFNALIVAGTFLAIGVSITVIQKMRK